MRKGRERKRERELFIQHFTLNPSIQIFKRFLLEMLMEDFWGKKKKKKLFYLVCLQKQLRLTIPFELLKHNYEIFFWCQIIWIWETEERAEIIWSMVMWILINEYLQITTIFSTTEKSRFYLYEVMTLIL